MDETFAKIALCTVVIASLMLAVVNVATVYYCSAAGGSAVTLFLNTVCLK